MNKEGRGGSPSRFFDSSIASISEKYNKLSIWTAYLHNYRYWNLINISSFVFRKELFCSFKDNIKVIRVPYSLGHK
ncbi:hypothetical protein COA27_29045 [Bacillus cereus]|nr:hypothetical protein COA27_29045 [Bacillus cereus]